VRHNSLPATPFRAVVLNRGSTPSQWASKNFRGSWSLRALQKIFFSTNFYNFLLFLQLI